MLTRFAGLASNRARAVVLTAVVFFAVAGVIGGGVADRLIAGGFEDPDSESFKASEALEDQFEGGVPNVVLLVTARSGSVDDPDVAAAGQAVTEELRTSPNVTAVVSYWSENNAPPLRSDDGDRALVVGHIQSEDDSQLIDRIEELTPQLAAEGPDVTVEVTGYAEVFREVNETIEGDLLLAELIAVPITLVLLVLIFGSVVAASLPVLVGAMSVLGTFLVLRVVAELTDVSIYALNLTTAMGAGPGHRLQPVHRVPLPGGVAGRLRAARGGEPHRPHRRSNRGLQRPHGRRLAVRPAGVPHLLPAQLRLRRRGGGGAGRPVRGAGTAGHPAVAGPSGERPHHHAALGHPARDRVLAPGRPGGDAPAAADCPRGGGGPAAAGLAVPGDQPDPARRPGAARVGQQPAGGRCHP